MKMPFRRVSAVVAGIAFLVPLAAITGCTRTYISTGDLGVPSPDGVTRVCLTSHGAYGRAYIDRTKKLVDVRIKQGSGTNERILFLHRYRFVGADLSEDVQWNSPKKVTVQVYDYNDGVFESDARKAGIVSNHIATLIFEMDTQSGKFVQANP